MADDNEALSSCVVCLEAIKPADSIWHCKSNCFIVLHLLCAQRTAAVNLNNASRLVGELLGSSETCWYCPHCRHPYTEYPSLSTCFCGAVKNPALDPWLPPHSCGGTCKGKRKGCDHPCLDQCHSGPHPPCTIAIKQRCFCGKKDDTVRCGTNKASCGQQCSKIGLNRLLATSSNLDPRRKALSQCIHACKAACHDGDCPPCSEAVMASCLCGSETKKLPCAARIFKCKRACPRGLLACGRCVCPLGCHDGPCPPCPNSERRTCGCGKEAFDGLPCNAETPRCGATCGKKLPQCEHRCQERCHGGECGKCMEIVDARCRCGKSTKRKVCSAVVISAGGGAGPAAADEDDSACASFLCSVKCSAMLDCGRHACKRRCCDGSAEAHACKEVCTRKLNCGVHACGRRCHKDSVGKPSSSSAAVSASACGVCPLTVTLSCPCGGTRKTFPCGKQPAPGTMLPCKLPCQRPPTCSRHPQRQRHPCHEGLCPPCNQVCCAAQPRCGHACALPCHSETITAEMIAALMSSTSSSSTAGGGAGTGAGAGSAFPQLPQHAAATALAAAMAQMRIPTPCAPCSVPVERSCVGGHVTRSLACAAPALFRCDNPCGAPLPCSKHTCLKPCHGGRGGPGCSTSCGQLCTEPRPSGCTHRCATESGGACHRGPCAACNEVVKVRCLCGRSDIELACHLKAFATQALLQGTEEPEILRCKSFSKCGKALKRCNHLCGFAGCHGGACDDRFCCEKIVTVRCPCGVKKEEWPCSKVRATSAASSGGVSFSTVEKKGYQLLQCSEQDGCKLPAATSEPADGDADAITGSAAPVVSAEDKQALKQERYDLKRRKKQQEEQEAEAARVAAEAKRKVEEEVREKERQKRNAVLLAIAALVVLWLLKNALGL